MNITNLELVERIEQLEHMIASSDNEQAIAYWYEEKNELENCLSSDGLPF